MIEYLIRHPTRAFKWCKLGTDTDQNSQFSFASDSFLRIAENLQQQNLWCDGIVLALWIDKNEQRRNDLNIMFYYLNQLNILMKQCHTASSRYQCRTQDLPVMGTKYTMIPWQRRLE